MYGCQKVDSILQMYIRSGQNTKMYAGGTVRIDDSFTMSYSSSISRIPISWSFLIMQVGIQKEGMLF